MSRKSLAIVASAANVPPVMEEVILDELRPDEAYVEIHAVGVCHADLAVLLGHVPLPFPRVLGHEGSGVVKAVGANIKHVQSGDKVILSFNPCRECKNCKIKLPSYCDDMRPRNWLGVRPDKSFTMKSTDAKPIHGNFFGQSSFARLAVVNESCLVKVPQDTDLKLFAPLGCGIQTGYGVMTNVLDVQPGDSVIISGCGAVGMSAIMAAKIRGAGIIVAVDIQDKRLSIAKEIGATHVLNGGDKDLIDQVRGICPLPAGFRYAFDTTAVPSVIEDMIEAVGVRGKTVVVGATPADKTVTIRPLRFLDMGKQFIGSCEGESYPPEAIPNLIELSRQGKLPLEKIIKYYKAADFAQAFEDMESGKTIKPVLVWDDVDSSN